MPDDSIRPLRLSGGPAAAPASCAARSNRPTIFVLDHDDCFRNSLVSLMEALGYRTSGHGSAESLLEAYSPSQPGCLILELRLPGRCGLDVYAEMTKGGRRIPAIFVSAEADVMSAVMAMKAGAIEFLEKPFSKKRLIELVDEGLQADARWRAADERFRRLDERLQPLSRGDRETLDMILEGATNKAMAARLFISERAVELRRQRLMQRLGVRSVAELLELSLTHRILAEVRSASTDLA